MDFWGFEGREEMVGGRFGLLMADPPTTGGVSGPAAAPSTAGDQTPVWENKIKEAETKLESHPDFKKNLEGNKDFLAQFNDGKKPEKPEDFLTAIKNAKAENAKDKDTRFMVDRETKLKELEGWVKKEYQPRLDSISEARKLYQSNKGQDAEKADKLLIQAGLLPKKGEETPAPQGKATSPAGKPTVNTQSGPATVPQANPQTPPVQSPPQQQPQPPSANPVVSGLGAFNQGVNAAAAATVGLGNLRTAGEYAFGPRNYGGVGGYGYGSTGPGGYNVGVGGPGGYSAASGGVGGFDPFGGGAGIGVESDEARERSRRTEAEIQQLLSSIMSGNMDAIASALILMTFKAKQTMLKAAALVVRAMQLYDKQMEGQNEKMKALAGKGFNPEIGQQFEIARQEMNQISTQRQSISNNLRDIMSMVEEIGNNEKGYLDKKFQIQSSHSRWV